MKKIASRSVAAVDLFCGIGGKTYGFIKAGIPVVAGVDIDPSCAYAFEANNKGAKFHQKSVEDLAATEVAAWYPEGAVRVLIGCAPCQPFSTYSRRYRSSPRKRKKDERWKLLSSFGRLVRELQPEIVTAENVPELAQLKHKVYQKFISDLRALGYKVTEQIVKCADYGVPQTRERLVVLASKLGQLDLTAPTHSSKDYVTVRDAIRHLPHIGAGDPAPANDPLHRSPSLSAINLKRIKATPAGGGWRDWPEELRLECHKKHTGKTFPSVYGRIRWDELGPTITTQCYGLGNGRFGHPAQHRALSLREAALLQTFPPDYLFAAPRTPIYYKRIGMQIGNAVPVELGAAIGRSIIRHLQAEGGASLDAGIRIAG